MANEPSEATPETLTRLLSDMRHGSRYALDALLPLVYDELRILAHRQRQRWRGDHTLGTTALVHEAYLKLANQEGVRASSRAHFFALASRAMRHILCNYARDRQAKKRGGDFEIVELDSSLDQAADESGSTDQYAEQLVALDAALARLEQDHPRRSRVVECRFFGGMTVVDTAAALGISPRTVKRDWAAAQDWLRREVSLLRQQPEEAAQTLDDLAANALPPLLGALAQPEGEELRPGQRVAQYEVVATLGRGGMGVVYKAYDQRLDRHVALKFLPSYLASDDAARARLTSEARAASALDHPNICTIYDIGELEDGRMFLALACYEGEILKDRIAAGPLAVEEVVAITAQIAQALSAAHRRGIVHRDIKPSNVMITTDGMVKILDFGIAKLREADLTQGPAMGTLGYMSAEQLRGETTDARTDLWSLGVVVYEMLTGRRPFEGADQQRLMQAIRTEPVTPLAELRAGLPPQLVRVVETCLQKDPEARYRNADELLAELPGPEVRAGGSSVPFRRVAVLPLESPTSAADDGYLAEGIAEELRDRLSGLSGLQVIARTSTMQFRESGKDEAQIGSELGADTIVQGAVARSGENVSITLQLVDVTRSDPLWATEQNVPISELQNALRAMAWQITSELAVQVYGDERRQLAREGTESAAAYALYLKGRYFWNKRDRTNIQQARACFEQALDLDPVFARAWAGLADTFCVLGGYLLLQPEDAYPRARAAAEQALAIDEDLAEAHASLATVLADHYWNWSAAGEHYRRAVSLNPSYATARLWYAGFLRDLGEFDEALIQVRAGRELDPLSLPAQAAEGITLYVARRYPEAVAAYRRLLEITPTFTYAYFLLALALAQEGRYAEALASLQKVGNWGGGVADVRGLSGYIHATLGRHVEAREMLEALDDPASEQHATPFHRAVIHVALGESDRALQLLEQAHDARAKQIRLLRIEPMLDPIRGEPRFQALLEKVGLTDAAVARALAP